MLAHAQIQLVPPRQELRLRRNQRHGDPGGPTGKRTAQGRLNLGIRSGVIRQNLKLWSRYALKRSAYIKLTRQRIIAKQLHLRLSRKRCDSTTVQEVLAGVDNEAL